MAGKYRTQYYDIDIAMVIDATSGMNYWIELLKENAKNLYPDFCKRLREDRLKGREINQMRIRVITFRDFKDYLNTGYSPLQATRFFNMPEDTEAFYRSVSEIEAKGGGGDIKGYRKYGADPEDGLEALATAIKSEWVPEKQGIDRRHIIVLWTDAPTHELGYGSNVDCYPEGIPKDFEELTQWWEEMDYMSKRLVLFAPCMEHWRRILSSWKNVIFVENVPGRYAETMAELQESDDYGTILDLLVHTEELKTPHTNSRKIQKRRLHNGWKIQNTI